METQETFRNADHLQTARVAAGKLKKLGPPAAQMQWCYEVAMSLDSPPSHIPILDNHLSS